MPMKSQQMPDSVRQAIADLNKYRRADGVVLTNVDVHKVIDAIAAGSLIWLELLLVAPGRQLVEADGYMELVASCSCEMVMFNDVRELAVQPGGGGVFEFTATYFSHQRLAAFSEHGTYSGNYRFHVNNKGRATYVVQG